MRVEQAERERGRHPLGRIYRVREARGQEVKSVKGKLVVKKLMAQINYSTRVGWFTEHPKIFQGYLDAPDRFSRWAHGPGHFEVIAPKEYRHLVAGPKQANASLENIETNLIRDELNDFAGFFGSVLSHLKPDKIDRLGVRAFFLVPTSSFSDLVSALRKDFVGPLVNTTAFSNARESDFMLIWELENGDTQPARGRAKWQLGPVRREEFGKWFESTSQQADEERKWFPSTAFMGDIDWMTTEVEASPDALAKGLLANWESAYSAFEDIATAVARDC